MKESLLGVHSPSVHTWWQTSVIGGWGRTTTENQASLGSVTPCLKKKKREQEGGGRRRRKEEEEEGEKEKEEEEWGGRRRERRSGGRREEEEEEEEVLIAEDWPNGWVPYPHTGYP